MTEFVVGQELYFVASQRYNAHDTRPAKITKVGRKWLELDNHYRVDRDNLIADGGQFISPGRAYRSRADYDDEKLRSELWSQIKNAVAGYSVPRCATTEQLKAVLAALSQFQRSEGK